MRCAIHTGMSESRMASTADDVDDRQLPRARQVGEDPDRQRLLLAGGERGHDDLVEAEREGQQRARHERRAQLREDDVAEGLQAVGAEVGRRLLERLRGAPQPGHDVVEDHDDAERRVADDDRQQAQRHAEHLREGRVERHGGDDARQRDRQDDEERDRLAAEEAVARDGDRGHACRAASATAVASSPHLTLVHSASRTPGLCSARSNHEKVRPAGGHFCTPRRVERVDRG